MLTINKEQCTGCGACRNVCPADCIQMVPDAEGFLFPKVDGKACISCGRCEQTCPVLNLQQGEPSDVLPEAYAAYSRDSQTRSASSSGGVFTELSRYVLHRGGVVFGAAMDERLQVVHRCVETEEELTALRGSKYVQSSIGLTYRQVRQFLKADRLVLFTGTPCQIGGLRRFLKQDYDNLITQDVVCHGVPSPNAWKAYLKFREKQLGQQLQQVDFREKVPGWRRYSLKLKLADGTEHTCEAAQDPYMRAFVKDLSLRSSCYRCAFKGLHRCADITLADFWGIEHICPEMDDDKGTSLVLLHTEKGKAFFEEIKEQLHCKPTDAEAACAYNPAMVKPSQSHAQRPLFYDKIASASFDCVVNAACPKKSLIRRVREKLKRVLR